MQRAGESPGLSDYQTFLDALTAQRHVALASAGSHDLFCNRLFKMLIRGETLQTNSCEAALGRTHPHLHAIGIDHRVGQPPIALQAIGLIEGDDPFAFFRPQLLITRYPSMVLVDRAVALTPLR